MLTSLNLHQLKMVFILIFGNIIFQEINNEKGINNHVDEIVDQNTSYELKSYFSGFPQNLVLVATTDWKHMYIYGMFRNMNLCEN